MDTLDIYELPGDAHVIVTVEALRNLFSRARHYGELDAGFVVHDVDFTIKGEIA